MTPTSVFRRVTPPALGTPLPNRSSHHFGQSLVEWTLLLALISITCVASLSQLGQGVSTTLETVNGTLMGNLGGAPMGGEGSPPMGAPNPDPNGDPSEPPMGQNIGAPLNYP